MGGCSVQLPHAFNSRQVKRAGWRRTSPPAHGTLQLADIYTQHVLLRCAGDQRQGWHARVGRPAGRG